MISIAPTQLWCSAVVSTFGLQPPPNCTSVVWPRELPSEFDHGLDARFNREMLLRNGVPASAIVEFSFLPHSTYGEARGLLDWAQVSKPHGSYFPYPISPRG